MPSLSVIYSGVKNENRDSLNQRKVEDKKFSQNFHQIKLLRCIRYCKELIESYLSK